MLVVVRCIIVVRCQLLFGVHTSNTSSCAPQSTQPATLYPLPAISLVWPGCHQVASNYLVCDNATVNTSACFRVNGCVVHNHPALSLAHGSFKIVCNVIDDTGLQVGVITESMVDAKSAVDTGLQVGVASMTKVGTKSLFPDSPGKLRDEVVMEIT